MRVGTGHLSNFERCSSCSCVCQILIAAAKAANFNSCQILKELRQLQIFLGPVKFQGSCDSHPLPNFTMRSSCVWRGGLPHSICSIWAIENYELDTRSEKNISKCAWLELFEVLSLFLFSRTKLVPLSFISKFWGRRILIFSQISYIIYIESEGRKWKKKELFTL